MWALSSSTRFPGKQPWNVKGMQGGTYYLSIIDPSQMICKMRKEPNPPFDLSLGGDIGQIEIKYSA